MGVEALGCVDCPGTASVALCDSLAAVALDAAGCVLVSLVGRSRDEDRGGGTNDCGGMEDSGSTVLALAWRSPTRIPMCARFHVTASQACDVSHIHRRVNEHTLHWHWRSRDGLGARLTHWLYSRLRRSIHGGGGVVLTAVLWRAGGYAIDVVVKLGTRVSRSALHGLRKATVLRRSVCWCAEGGGSAVGSRWMWWWSSGRWWLGE